MQKQKVRLINRKVYFPDFLLSAIIVAYVQRKPIRSWLVNNLRFVGKEIKRFLYIGGALPTHFIGMKFMVTKS